MSAAARAAAAYAEREAREAREREQEVVDEIMSKPRLVCLFFCRFLILLFIVGVFFVDY